MMKLRVPRRRLVLGSAVAAVVLLAAWLFVPGEASELDPLAAPVRSGEFRVVVTTAGELRARKFVQVQGPMNAQAAQIYQMKISSLVPEGTRVKAGDVVAELDRANAAAKHAEVALALQKAEAQLMQAQLDSTLNLSKAREDMRTMEYGLEEKRLAKEQSIYEAPTVKRQAEIDYEKAQRALVQAKTDYVTKTSQAIAKMSEVGADVQRQRNNVNNVMQVMEQFTIKAPADGMVIYVKEWNGRKKVVGSQINPWEPTVATLPDLSQMESITYVNEIDVRKIAVGNTVTVALDADPSKRLTGKVESVANVGEQRPNQDAKVFEVKITVAQNDTTLRPGMTTSNVIETYALKNVLYIPLEAVFNTGDTTFVYKRTSRGVVRQEIEPGPMNDVEIVVTRGLAKDDRVLLTAPANDAGIETVNLSPPPKRTPVGDTPTTRVVGGNASSR
jgi:RND family efflux transporter MFP subunit